LPAVPRLVVGTVPASAVGPSAQEKSGPRPDPAGTQSSCDGIPPALLPLSLRAPPGQPAMALYDRTLGPQVMPPSERKILPPKHQLAPVPVVPGRRFSIRLLIPALRLWPFPRHPECGANSGEPVRREVKLGEVPYCRVLHERCRCGDWSGESRPIPPRRGRGRAAKQGRPSDTVATSKLQHKAPNGPSAGDYGGDHRDQGE
jgi:hypothetical protein